MAKVTPITEHFQHFVADLKESFWGDMQGQAQGAVGRLFELLSERQRDLYMVSPRYGGSRGRGFRRCKAKSCWRRARFSSRRSRRE